MAMASLPGVLAANWDTASAISISEQPVNSGTENAGHISMSWVQWHRDCRTHLNVLDTVTQRLQDTSQCSGHSGTETAGHISMFWAQWHRDCRTECPGHSGTETAGHISMSWTQWHRDCRTHLNVLDTVAQTAGHISMFWAQWQIKSRSGNVSLLAAVEA